MADSLGRPSRRETARDFTGGVKPFFVIDCEREKIYPFAGQTRPGGRGENDRVTDVHGHCAARLQGEGASFDGNLQNDVSVSYFRSFRVCRGKQFEHIPDSCDRDVT